MNQTEKKKQHQTEKKKHFSNIKDRNISWHITLPSQQ